MTETERVLMIRENNKLAILVCLFRIRVETNAASVKLWKYGSIQSAKCKMQIYTGGSCNILFRATLTLLWTIISACEQTRSWLFPNTGRSARYTRVCSAVRTARLAGG